MVTAVGNLDIDIGVSDVVIVVVVVAVVEVVVVVVVVVVGGGGGGGGLFFWCLWPHFVLTRENVGRI